MSIDLKKGENLNLSKSNPEVNKFKIGCGWSPNDMGKSFDLDASCFILGDDNKLVTDSHFVYYKNLKSPSEFVSHFGDNLTGEGEGDDEVIIVDKSKATTEEKRVLFVVTIYEGKEKGQNFGQVSNSYIRIMNADTDEELAIYELGEDFATETALVFGELYFHNGDLKFKSVGAGMNSSLQDFVDLYRK